MFIKSPYRASIVRVHVYASVHYVVVSWFVGLRTPAFCKWVVAAIILMNKHDIPKGQIISKAIFVFLTSSKNERKLFDLLYHSTFEIN